jgi:dihydrofolate reductase
MKYSIIAAISKNNVLGKDNRLLWKLSDDMKMFRQLTTGNTVIMGRKTFDSMGKALPNRNNIIITRNPNFSAPDCLTSNSLKEAIMLGEKSNSKIYIIGGGEIYKQAMNDAEELIITQVDCTIDGDTYFPEINTNVWLKNEGIHYTKNDKNEFDFEVVKYLRK